MASALIAGDRCLFFSMLVRSASGRLQFHLLKLRNVTSSRPKSKAGSSRSQTHATGNFIRETAGSQSLERGLQLLRAFRTGVTILTNSDLASRTGLPRPTVSRLTRSLVDTGFLLYDMERRAYRLSAVCLSLAEAFQRAVPEVRVAESFMKKVAEQHKVNAGLATADQLDMVYLAAFRESMDPVSRTRKVVAGSRVPIWRSAIGRAYVAGLDPGPREALLHQIALSARKAWPDLKERFDQARGEIERYGFCSGDWEPGVLTGIGTWLIGPNNTCYALNISAQLIDGHKPSLVQKYGKLLLRLAADISDAWNESFSAPAAQEPPFKGRQ